MKQYGFISDKLSRRGFIKKEDILAVITQEEIFKLVFKELPIEFKYVKSPFREDTNPGCWFHYNIDGKLRFTDFGNPAVINGISMGNIDCFDCVQVYFKIANFYLTLEFIFNHLIKGKNVDTDNRIEIQVQKNEKKAVKILIEPRLFNSKDAAYWTSYGVSKAQLIEDKVFPISRYHALNTKFGNFSSTCPDISYAYTEFKEGRKKLYFPQKEGNKRFLTTCSKEDVGGTTSLSYGKQLIISKAYKDYRVLKNEGKNVKWLQNEGMVPSLDNLTELVKDFKNVIVFFDNDETGIKASKDITDIINSISRGKAKSLHLPERLLSEKISDPSDLFLRRGKTSLTNFLNTFT
jgi:hypothetical protein